MAFAGVLVALLEHFLSRFDTVGLLWRDGSFSDVRPP